MSFWRNLGEAYKDEAKDAMDNRNYGPMMGLTVIVFWAVVVVLIVKAVS